MLTAKPPTAAPAPVVLVQNVIIPSMYAVVSRVMLIDIPGISTKVAEVVVCAEASST
jgi:hypothetical protein